MHPRTRRYQKRHHQKKDKARDQLKSRLMYVVTALVLFLGFAQYSMVKVALTPVAEPEQRVTDMPYEKPTRGNIYDRNKVLLATTLTIQSLYADPKHIIDVDEVVTKLSHLLPELDAEKIRDRLTKKHMRFVWLKRHLTPEQVYQINALGLPGLYFREEEKRFYPHKFSASHVLGAVNRNGNGIAGVEGSYNNELVRGRDVVLNIDIRVQEALRRALMKGLETTKAKSVSAAVMDPRTGEVLAMSSLPDFDANHYGQASPIQWKNRVMSSVYEMGSTFKIFTMAQGLEEKVVTTETPLDCTRPLKVGRFRIRDLYPRNTYLSVAETFVYSSNIGTARVADMMERGKQKHFFESLGLLDKLDIGLIEQSQTLYPEDGRWGRVATMSMSYGHGIAVSPMHLLSASAVVLYDGKYRQPMIAQVEKQEEPKQVISLETAKQMRKLVRRVVKEGTGRKANIIGYDIGGKTGTAEKSVEGGYSDNKNIASFVGVVPAQSPQLVGVVVVDEGIKGHDTGGRAAAPIFKDFVKSAAPILGIAPTAFLGENALDDIYAVTEKRRQADVYMPATFRP